MFGNSQDPVSNSDRLDLFGDYLLTEEDVDLISSFSGGNKQNIVSLMGILPYFSLFHSIYMRSITRLKDRYIRNQHRIEHDFKWSERESSTISSVRIGRHGRKWFVEREDWDKEYLEFEEKFILAEIEDGRTAHEAREKLQQKFISSETSSRFYNYFSGQYTTCVPITGSCSWPLGCVQNIPEHEDYPMIESLLSEREHSKPSTLYSREPDQSMCYIHNRWKTWNPVFDLGGILWCIFGDELNLDD